MKQKLCILLCVISLGGGCAWEKISGVTYQPEEQINPPKKENTTEKKTASIEEKKEIAKTESSIDVPENSIEYDNEPLKEEKESLPKELESLFITAEQFYSKGLDYAEQGKWDLAEEEFENALELLHNSPVREKYPEEVNNFYNELSLDILDKLEQNEDSDIRTREEILLAKIKAKPEEERTIKEKVLLDLRELKFDIPIEVNDKVIRYIEYYTVENKEKFETWLGRSGAYMPILRKIFKEEGLPLDLTYLPIIESAFKTSAYSRARAAGLWQFIPGTARKYGLHITWWVDERRDFEKATRSAAKYLKFLKEELGSWYLALAGYNAGEGRVKRAITYQRTKNFWKLRLPRETMNYIPAFLASVIVAKNPSHYGLNVDYEKPISFEKVTIDRSVDLDTIAKCANTTKEEIKKLNPEIRYWATPPLKEYTIRIPKGRALAFKKAFAKAKDSYSLAWNKYKVRPGDSLYLISRNFGVPIGVIAEANNIRNPRLIRVGQTILVPNKWNRGFKSTANYPIGELVIHLVRRGETLSHIARKYGTTVSSIMRWNNLKSAKKIFPNQRLKVYAGLTSKEITPQIDTAQINNAKKDQSGRYIIHKVRRGENLWLISRKYGVTISSLMKWNNIRYANRIKPGQPIKVYLERVALSSKKNSTVQRTESKNSSTNETIIYKVKKGDSLWSISKKYGVSIENIKRWNNLKYSNRLMPGDELRINLAESDSSESSSTKVRIAKNENESTGYIIHKVKKGETLWVIAKRYGVSIANIMEWNNIRSARKLRPSQKLKIYKKEFLSS